jgi:hypothetical protein
VPGPPTGTAIEPDDQVVGGRVDGGLEDEVERARGVVVVDGDQARVHLAQVKGDLGQLLDLEVCGGLVLSATTGKGQALTLCRPGEESVGAGRGMRLRRQVSLSKLALDVLAIAAAARKIPDPRRGGEDGEQQDDQTGDVEQHRERSIGEKGPQRSPWRRKEKRSASAGHLYDGRPVCTVCTHDIARALARGWYPATFPKADSVEIAEAGRTEKEGGCKMVDLEVFARAAHTTYVRDEICAALHWSTYVTWYWICSMLYVHMYVDHQLSKSTRRGLSSEGPNHVTKLGNPAMVGNPHGKGKSPGGGLRRLMCTGCQAGMSRAEDGREVILWR